MRKKVGCVKRAIVNTAPFGSLELWGHGKKVILVWLPNPGSKQLRISKVALCLSCGQEDKEGNKDVST